MKFSIIIPVYNVAPYLRECLDSVLAQTYTDWEAICVDDGSTDGSGAILDEYAAKVEKLGGGGRRMVVLHQKNAGVSAARNAGLDVARGEWVWFVDADDSIRFDSLQLLANAIRIATDATLLFLDHTEKPFSAVGRKPSAVKKFILTKQNENAAWRSVWMCVFKRRLIGRIRFKHFRIAEDVLFVFTYMDEHADGWYELEDCLYYYRIRQGSASFFVPDESYIDEYFRVSTDIYGRMSKVMFERGLEVSWYLEAAYHTPKYGLFLLNNFQYKKHVETYLKHMRALLKWEKCESVLRFSKYKRFSLEVLSKFQNLYFGRIFVYYPSIINDWMHRVKKYVRSLIRKMPLVDRIYVSFRHA